MNTGLPIALKFSAVLFSLNIFIWILNIKFCKKNSVFENLLLNLLFIVSLYAVISTQLRTIYIISFVGVPVYFYKNGFTFSFQPLRHLIKTLLIANTIWVVFFITYFVLGGFEFQVPHVDFIISSRLAYYNDLFGVENTQGFYNLFSHEVTNEIYHYFELWLMDIANFINRQGRLFNSMFLVYPLIGYVVFEGFESVVKSGNKIISLILLFCSLVITTPYDFIWQLSGLTLPLSAIGHIFFNLKHMLILSIAIYVLKGISEDALDNAVVCMISLLYPLIIPVLIPALILFQLFRNGFKIQSVSVILVSFVMISGIFMLLNRPGPVGIGTSDFLNLRLPAKILFVGLFVPAISFCIIFLVDYNTSLKRRPVFIFLGIANVVALSLCYLLQQNIDANQFFTIPFCSLLVVLTTVCMYQLCLKKYYFYLALACLVYGAPFVYLCMNINFVKPAEKLREIAQSLPVGEKVLYIPLKSEVTNVFDYTERMSNPINSIFLMREDLHVINIAASFKPSFKLDNATRKSMYEYSRGNSPYYKFCGEFNESDTTCLYAFSRNCQIGYILADASLYFDLQKVKQVGNLTLYSFKE